MACELSRMTRVLIELTVSAEYAAKFHKGEAERKQVLREIQEKLGIQLTGKELNALTAIDRDNIESFSCTQDTFVNVILVGTDTAVTVNGVLVQPVTKTSRK